MNHMNLPLVCRLHNLVKLLRSQIPIISCSRKKSQNSAGQNDQKNNDLTYSETGSGSVDEAYTEVSPEKSQRLNNGDQTEEINKPKYSISDTECVQKIKRLEAIGLPIVHHHGYVCDLPMNHRFKMRKFHGVMRYLRKDNVISMKQVVTPEPVSAEAACRVHSSEYIDKFFNGRTSTDEQRKTGFVWTEGLARRCRLETGGTITACEIAMERGLASSTGGGTHHAFPDYGSGFCLINDLAIAAAHMLESGSAERILIVGLDVHQGDGTAVVFQKEERVFTFSMHCKKNFPLKKQTSDFDLEVEENTEDSVYLGLLASHLPRILTVFKPDLVLYDAGVDPHHNDELGKLQLTDQGLFDRDCYVLDQALSRGIPCVTVIGGGYCEINELSLRHTIIHRAATKIWQEKGL